MKTSDNGKSLIKHFEGLKLSAYKDVGGIWTIGWGHTGPDIIEGLTINKDIAEFLFDSDLSYFEDKVSNAVFTALNNNQFDAIISFVYNLGMGSLLHSTLLKDLNKGNYQDAAGEFSKWIYVNHSPQASLVTRRHLEKELFMTPMDEVFNIHATV